MGEKDTRRGYIDTDENEFAIKNIETYLKWTPEEYISFIGQNGFQVERWQVLSAAFPLVYLEARKVC